MDRISLIGNTYNVLTYNIWFSFLIIITILFVTPLIMKNYWKVF